MPRLAIPSFLIILRGQNAFPMNYRILLVDDEPDILEFIGYNLRKAGYEVETAPDGTQAVARAAAFAPHLILLDVMMPGMDGFRACRAIRQTPGLQNVMIAFLTARGEDASQIEGFDAGADDYIPKPVRIDVLMSRLKAMLKRLDPVPAAPGLSVDRQRFVAVSNGQSIPLPRKEFLLLEMLLAKPGRVFTREEIFGTVWGDGVVVGDRTIDVHIRKLREKIGESHIVTVKGVGYKYEN